MPSRSGVTSNFGDFSRDITAMSERFQTEVKEIVEMTLGDIELDAIRNAPGPGEKILTDYGYETQESIRRGFNLYMPISQAIGYKINQGGYSGEVFVEKSAGELAVYVEVGTGHSAREYLATVPPEWRSMAMLYYINGQGTIVDQPYMLPAVLKHEVIYKKEMKELIRRQMP